MQPNTTATESAYGDLPLAGVRILDFTHVVAGPYCTMMMADMGADVVKIERKGAGDDLRRVGRYTGRGPQDEDFFYTVNRRKRSVALDLDSPEDLRLVHRLASRADVAVENFAPGTAERLGIGAADLQKINPRLIYCSISGFGQTGPLKNRPAMDPIIQSMSGIMSVTGEADGPPFQVGSPIADVVAGMFAAYAIVSGLHKVARGGGGAVIDISMLESMIAVLGPRMGETLQTGRQPGRFGNENPLRAPSGLFFCADGEGINLIVQHQGFWVPFCAALERTEWVDDPRFRTMADRVENRRQLHELVAARMKEAPASHWEERFRTHRVPYGPYNDYPRALEEPHILERGLLMEVEHPASGRIRLIGAPWLGSFENRSTVPPPLLGQHTREVVADWLGEEHGSERQSARALDPGDEATASRREEHPPRRAK